MKRILTCLFLCLFLGTWSSAQEWNFPIYPEFDGFSNSGQVIATEDGGVLLLLTEFHANDKVGRLMKVDSSANIEWETQLPVWEFFSVKEDSILVANRGSDPDIFILDGQGLIQHHIQPTVQGYGQQQIEFHPLGGFYTVSYASEFEYLERFDFQGNILLSELYIANGIGSGNYDVLRALLFHPNGDYLLVATPNVPTESWCRKYEANGNPINFNAAICPEGISFQSEFGPLGEVVFPTDNSYSNYSVYDGTILTENVIPNVPSWVTYINGPNYLADGRPYFATLDPGGTPYLVQLSPSYTVERFFPLVFFDGLSYTNGVPIYSNISISRVLGGTFSALSDDAYYTTSKPSNSLNSPTHLIKWNGQGQFVARGNVFTQEDGACNLDLGEDINVEGIYVQAREINSNLIYSTYTDQMGEYTFQMDSGTYNLEVEPMSNTWDVCNTTQFDFIDDEVVLIDPVKVNNNDCIDLEVGIFANQLRRCFNNVYYVQVCNNGINSSSGATLEVELDPFISPGLPSIPYVSIINNTYLFNLPDLEYNECIDFTINCTVSCNSTLGQTHCTTARINTDNPCGEAEPFWDGSSIAVDGYCDTDSVRFEILNQGAENMSQPLPYFIRKDADLHETGWFQSNAGANSSFAFPADGSTWRIEANQANGHPGFSNPALSIEGCVDGGGPFSMGFVTPFAPDDEDFLIDIFCASNIGSYDPNDKQAEPIGYGDEHFIEKNTELEYLIRFQNTGTDTAFNIEIRDTLPESLAPWTLQMGLSSHDYRHNIIEGNILIVRYDNIMLPDSNVDVAGSNGYIKFKIRQRPNLPIGTLIENSAAFISTSMSQSSRIRYFIRLEKIFS